LSMTNRGFRHSESGWSPGLRFSVIREKVLKKPQTGIFQ
jgi:hypothetical protein